ncbi:unnamed protein product [Heterobilharzia americana]|nr:unnamed protein product [Heterobilharzia americana]
MNRDWLYFSEEEIKCNIKKVYQTFSEAELLRWIKDSSLFLLKHEEAWSTKLMNSLFRFKHVISCTYTENPIVLDTVKTSYFQIFLYNIDYVIALRKFEYLLSDSPLCGTLCYIPSIHDQHKKVLLTISRNLGSNELIKTNAINFLKIYHISWSIFHRSLTLHLLWVYFFVSRSLSSNDLDFIKLKLHVSVITSKVLEYCGCSEASEALARKSIVDFSELIQLYNRDKSLAPAELIPIFHVAAIELSSLVFKRSVFESRKRPQGYLRPKVKVEFATILQHSWPRTQTERYLNQLLPSSSAQILAILEALSLNPGERRSLVNPKPPVDPSDWEMSDVYCELFIAALELIYPNTSRKLVPNFTTGAHVMRKVPSDRERNPDNVTYHTIALNDRNALKWTQLDLLHHQYNYRKFNVKGDSSYNTSTTPSNISTILSCTIDSLMELIQILYACAQYDIFDLMSRETLFVFQGKLLELTKENSPREFIQHIQVQIDTIELLRALHSAHLSKRLLSKSETMEDVNSQEVRVVNSSKNSTQQDTSNLMMDSLDNEKEVNLTRPTQDQTFILDFLPKGILKLVEKLEGLISKKDEFKFQINFYDTGIFVDAILVLWEHCHTTCQKWLLYSRIKHEYFDGNRSKFLGLLYLLSLIRTTVEWLNIDVADGLMSANLAFYTIWIMELFEHKMFIFHNSPEASNRQLSNNNVNIRDVLQAFDLQLKLKESRASREFNKCDQSTVCIIGDWTSIWKKVKGVIDWARSTINERVIHLQINQPHNLELNALSEIQVELLWFEYTVRWKLRNLEWLAWCDSNESTNEKVDKKIDQMNENLLKECDRNPISKVFYYCLKAETEVNDEKAKKYYQTAEKFLFTKWQNETYVIKNTGTTCTHPSEDFSESENGTILSDRPPPPILVAKCENSMVFKAQKWIPPTKESVYSYALYGKQTFVANQKVHITDNKLTNTGIMVINNNGSCFLKVSNLVPNKEYAFAVAAYNEKGQPLGSHKFGLGQSTKPILASSTLCNYAALCHLIQSGCRRDLFQCLSVQSTDKVWEYLTTKYDTLNNTKSTHLTGLRLKDSDAFHCSNILLKQFTTCILWQCLHIQKSENLRSNNSENNNIYLLNTQIKKLHLSEKLLIGLELSAKLNDVQLLLDFASLIYETLEYNINMNSVTTDYAKILIQSVTILLGVRKCFKKLILLDETLNSKLTKTIVKFTFGCVQVLETLNELKGVIAILKNVKAVLNQVIKDVKPTVSQTTRKRISQVKLNSNFSTKGERKQSVQNLDELDELNLVIRTIDAYSYLVTAKLSPPKVELFGYEDPYQAIACMATKPLKTAIKDGE